MVHRVCGALLPLGLAACLVCVFCAGVAGASGRLAFVDAQHGRLLTMEGGVDYHHPGQAVLWGTEDGGTTWTRLAVREPAGSMGGGIVPGALAFAGQDAGLWWRGSWQGTWWPLLRTADGGATWESADSPAESYLLDFTFATPDVVWGCAAQEALANGIVVRSQDGGRTWHTVLRTQTWPGLRYGASLVSVSAPRPQTCYVGSWSDGLWVTRDGGYRWQRHTVAGSNNVSAMAFPGAWTGWISQRLGDIYRTDDGGVTWTRQRRRGGSYLRALTFTDLRHGWAAGGQGVILRTRDAGASWERVQSGTRADLWELVFVDDENGWALGTSGSGLDPRDVLLRTRDGGQTWEALPAGGG